MSLPFSTRRVETTGITDVPANLAGDIELPPSAVALQVSGISAAQHETAIRTAGSIAVIVVINAVI